LAFLSAFSRRFSSLKHSNISLSSKRTIKD
jgi:hypothetical protein